MCFSILNKNELYVRNDVSIANQKVGKNQLSIRTGLRLSAYVSPWECVAGYCWSCHCCCPLLLCCCWPDGMVEDNCNTAMELAWCTVHA
jgi:hypothetical protein